MKKEPLYISYLMIIWAMLLIVAVALTFNSVTTVKNRLYDLQIEASTISSKAFAAIKLKKQELNIEMSDKDIYQSGMLGERISPIQTTTGSLEAKRTSINPNFSAVFIEMFRKAGLHEGDEIAIVLSGSFPALNISAMAASEVYGLKTCIMASIGASTYGANNPEFTYFDMAEFLYHENILKYRIDYVSLGGASDIGDDFLGNERNAIIERIEKSGVNFIYQTDYQTNIKYRIEKIFEKCPNVKLLLNVGGNLVAMGKDEAGFISKNGLIEPNYLDTSEKKDENKIGLLDTFLSLGISVIQMLNIKGLALKYGLPYDPINLPKVGYGDVYYEESFNILVPVIALILSVTLLVFYYVYRKKHI